MGAIPTMVLISACNKNLPFTKIREFNVMHDMFAMYSIRAVGQPRHIFSEQYKLVEQAIHCIITFDTLHKLYSPVRTHPVN